MKNLMMLIFICVLVVGGFTGIDQYQESHRIQPVIYAEENNVRERVPDSSILLLATSIQNMSEGIDEQVTRLEGWGNQEAQIALISLQIALQKEQTRLLLLIKKDV